ncbi:putative P-loop containing nucleoside triphosphate hydrolase, leucine-rich repeat domain, L [Medicago truncatula]|nr:NB-ARC domain disease resistance protein [Medicago truncatula]RHN67308.1 putative P-loop containing nucleoside triphosphate hydrolase, leucine-rich repeat domain, L [Medicago truncatula]
MDVAIYCKKSSFIEVYELQPLTNEQSFELFNKKTFQFDNNGCCPKELIDISFEISRKCKGLPLAIVAIGGLLSTKEKNVFEWQKFCKNMTLELKKDSLLAGISKILGFSYNDLPFYLKPCFLYFGMYPEDYEVGSRRLFRQWVAEGFVKEERGYTLEEVAERYLTELIHRSLVQVSSVRIDGKTKSCCVHDLIHMMILEKSEDISFCKHISEDDLSSLFEIIRRHSLTTYSKDFPACSENSHVRSLFLFKNGSQQMEDDHFMRRILTEYRRLKVLNIEGAMFLNLNGNMGSLIHLKYLSFYGSYIEVAYPEILESIGMLQNMETLDLRVSSYFHKLPKEISNFRKLRHLLGRGMSLLQLKGGIGGMKYLETLSKVRIDEDGIELLRELENLKKLRKLGLDNIQREHGSALSSLLKELRHLEKLHIVAKSYRYFLNEVIDIHLESPPPVLQNLKLNGVLNKFPRWILRLQNLLKLKLVGSRLTDNPIEHLDKMSNLLSLSIINKAYKGEILHFHDGGFQNLKELYITDLPDLNSIVIDEGALPSLKKFQLSRIPNLETVPAGIRYLKKLEVLNVFGVPHVEMYPKL